MPLYEWKCTNDKCDNLKSETLSYKNSDKYNHKACKKCNSGTLEKVYSGYSFILAGGGWPGKA